MGSHATTKEEIEKNRRFYRYTSSSSDSSYAKLKRQKYEQNREKFIKKIVEKQTHADKNIIDALNQREGTVQRMALVTSGKIKNKDIYLSIDENSNLIYDITDKNKCMTMFVEKETNIVQVGAINYNLSLITNGTRREFSSVNVHSYDWEENSSHYLPEEVVMKQGSFYIRTMSDLKSSEIKKLTQFVNTYLFAGTDTSATKIEMENKKEQEKKLKEKLDKLKRKKEEQIRAKAEKEAEMHAKIDKKRKREENKSFVKVFSSEHGFLNKVMDKIKGGLCK